MPFISGIDFQNLSRKIEDTCYRAIPVISAPEPQHLPAVPDFPYYLCTKEHCIKFVDLFTATSLVEVLQVDNASVQESLSRILNGNTDLIPNEYEGGFKVWEGLHDLIEYLEKNEVIEKMISGRDKEQEVVNILDLGCGSGLLSIFIAYQIRRKFPSIRFRIYLQDYNDNVIKYYTCPNILFNDVLQPLRSESEEKRKEEAFSRLISTVKTNYELLYGDWSPVTEELTKKSITFDLIVSAETLYSEDNYPKLLNLFYALLRRPAGQVLLATKSHYFGVGGGTWSFLDYVHQQGESKATAHLTEEKDATKGSKKQKVVHHPTGPKLEGNVVHEIEANLLRHIIQLKWT